jgi:hypothetical protein
MSALFLWLVFAAPIHDTHNRPIWITQEIAAAIAAACSVEDDPWRCAKTLFVLGARESSYRTRVLGDGGRSFGLFQCPRAITPDDALGQARLAISILKHAEDVCPGHALWTYASGKCIRSDVAVKYEKEIEALQ